MSRPLIGAKPPSSADLSAEVAPLGSPRVIISVPPSDPPPSNEPSDAPSGAPESLQTKAPSTMEPINIALSKLPTISDPPDTLITPVTPVTPITPEPLPAPVVTNADADDGNTKLFASTIATAKLDVTVKDEPQKPAVETKAEETKVEAKKVEETKAEETKVEAKKEEKKEEKTETTKTFASTLVFGSSTSKVDEPKPIEPKPNFSSTLAFGSAPTAPTTPSPAPKTDAKVELTKTQPMKVAPVKETLVKEAKNEKKNETKPETKSKGTTKELEKKKSLEKQSVKSVGVGVGAEDPDEISVPPIGDITEKFFSEGHLSRHLPPEPLVEDAALTVPDKIKRKADPVVAQRRARFARYVKWAVAGAAVVCMAAVARTTLTPSKASASLRNTASIAAPITESPETKAADPSIAPIAADPTTAPSAPTAPSTPVAVAEAPPADPATANAAPGDIAPAGEEVTGDPKEEKKKARVFLEKRKMAEAIEAAQKSVTLDPTDAEAWLLLGASHQEKGDMASARKAYASCVKEAKTGPRHECGKMLR